MEDKTYQLTITAEEIQSTDQRFTMDNLGLGDGYRPTEVYFQQANGEKLYRKCQKRERQISNQTLPRLICQIFESQLLALSEKEKHEFPIVRYHLKDDYIRGIYDTVKECQQATKKTLEYVCYNDNQNHPMVLYCWNIFSTIIFAQECLKRFGEQGDQVILHYTDKTNKKDRKKYSQIEEDNYISPFSQVVIDSKNVIFHGAPGTGKSYLAKSIAADIISQGETNQYDKLTEQQKQHIGFVQFHPSYDYSDFVEGLRPTIQEDGTMGFTLQDGIFKSFVKKAQENEQMSQESLSTYSHYQRARIQLDDYLSSIEFGIDALATSRGTQFYITSVDDHSIQIKIPDNEISQHITLDKNLLLQLLASDKELHQVRDVVSFFNRKYPTQQDSYYFTLLKDIQKNTLSIAPQSSHQIQKEPYVFIIDEINRGELSKIFGELFFSIDPGYRGKVGEVTTQYANLHAPSEGNFYIPDNVYIIGTMNDIDRSVDTFDFAMRRRFRFMNISVDEQLEMLNCLDDNTKKDAIQRMTALNQVICHIDDLGEAYCIGAAYFLKLDTLTIDQLWTDYLEPLLKDYMQGLYEAEVLLKRCKQAYYLENMTENDVIYD